MTICWGRSSGRSSATPCSDGASASSWAWAAAPIRSRSSTAATAGRAMGVVAARGPPRPRPAPRIGGGGRLRACPGRGAGAADHRRAGRTARPRSREGVAVEETGGATVRPFLARVAVVGRSDGPIGRGGTKGRRNQGGRNGLLDLHPSFAAGQGGLGTGLARGFAWPFPAPLWGELTGAPFAGFGRAPARRNLWGLRSGAGFLLSSPRWGGIGGPNWSRARGLPGPGLGGDPGRQKGGRTGTFFFRGTGVCAQGEGLTSPCLWRRFRAPGFFPGKRRAF